MFRKYSIDLFSDTNCSVSQGMRAFMAKAQVGNEVAGEDPTVNLLLERVSDILKKESAVFLPSGSMCNTLAFRTYCQRAGDGIVFEKNAHAVLKNPTIFGSVVPAQPILIEGVHGIYSGAQLEKILSKTKVYNEPAPYLVTVENPTNYGGGAIWSLQALKEIGDISKKYALPIYMDGARIFMASAKTGISPEKYVEHMDSVFVDFSKALGAPMGAVLAGSKAFIEDVWFHKFQFGGFMHKAGFLAAACLYGLDHNLQKLPEILDTTKLLKEELLQLPFMEIEFSEINILLIKVSHKKLKASDFERLLSQKGIRVHAFKENQLRLITHLDIGQKEALKVAKTFKEIAQSYT